MPLPNHAPAKATQSPVEIMQEKKGSKASLCRS